jgi:hypothetical protein
MVEATPYSDVGIMMLYWIFVLFTLASPLITDNYTAKTILLTFVIPNMLLSLSTGLPRLSVDRGYLIAAVFLATLVVFAVSEVHPRSKTTIKEFGKDKNKTLEGAGILTCAFVIGGILSYLIIDKSIYDSLKETNMNNAI